MDEQLWTVYDEIGEYFEQHAADSAYNAHYDRPAVLAALGDVTGLEVLDAACGPGLYAEELLGRGARVTGFDASDTMVRLARNRLGERARIDQARLGEQLPYPDAAFDRVVCALAIHHVSDRPAAFAEFRRVLRVGGRCVISTGHPTWDWLRKGGSYFDTVLETDQWETPYGPKELRFWREPLADLCAAALGAGFVIDLLTEPRAGEGVRERAPDSHAKLLVRPGFLVLGLRAVDW
jgi:ubiquinone/menaquinone biosynthesis C-methylase UbiE